MPPTDPSAQQHAWTHVREESPRSEPQELRRDSRNLSVSQASGDEKRYRDVRSPSPAELQWRTVGKSQELYTEYMVWFVVSLLSVIINKWIVTKFGFRYPLLLSTWYLLFIAITTQLLAGLRVISEKQLANDVFRNPRYFIPVAVLFSLSLITGNVAYVHLSIPYIQIIKGLLPVFVFILQLATGSARETGESWLSLGITSLGVCISSAGEKHFDSVGVAMQMLSVLGEALRIVFIERVCLGKPSSPLAILYYIAPPCVLINTFLFAVFEFEDFSHAVLPEHNSLSWTLVLIAGAALMMGAYLSSLSIITRASSLILSLCSVARDTTLIALSSLFLEGASSLLEIFGYVVTAAGMLLYGCAEPAPQRADVAQERSLPSSLSSSLRLPAAVLSGVLLVSLLASGHFSPNFTDSHSLFSFLSSHHQNVDEAYVYLMTRDDRLKTLLAAEMSHRKVNSTRPRFVYAPPGLHPDTLKLLKLFDLPIIPAAAFNGSTVASLATTEKAKWRDTPMKFQLFNSTFSRIVALDVDMLIRRNIDDLFDRSLFPDQFYAARDDFMCGDGPDWRVNGGVQVISKNETVTEDLLRMLYDPKAHWYQADQEILSSYHRNVADYEYILDSKYMAFLNRCECKEPGKFDDELNRIIHFSWYMSYDGEQWDKHWRTPERGTCHWKYRREMRELFFMAENYVFENSPHLYRYLQDVDTLAEAPDPWEEKPRVARPPQQKRDVAEEPNISMEELVKSGKIKQM